MRRMSVIGACFAVVLALSVMGVASASATEVLFSSATGSFKGTGGKVELNGASKIECLTSNSTGSVEDAHLGKLKVTLEKCSTQLLGTHECTGVKPASGTKGNIIYEGTFHIGLARKTSTETAHAAILILAEPATEYECTGVGIVKVSGSLIGLMQTKAGAPLEPPAELLHLVLSAKGSGTKQEDKEFLLALKENQLMAGQELSSEVFGVKGESAEIASSEITEVSPAGMHLVVG